MTKSSSIYMFLAAALCAGAGNLAPVVPTSSSQPAAEPEAAASSETTLLMRPADHRKVGEYFQACITARIEREGKGDAEEELRDYLEKKWMKQSKGRGPLALSDDLAAGLWHAINYSKVKGIKKGKVDKLDVPVGYYGEDFEANNAVWLPKKYSPKSKYPVILCIPDVDEKPIDHLNKYWADPELRDGAVLVALDMPKDPAFWGELGERGNPDKAGGHGILLSTFGSVRDRYAIDFDRVYLAGRGEGVAAAMQIASKAPDRFCGLIGRTGDAADMSPDNLSNVPMFFAGAGKRATKYEKAAKAAGYAECTLNPSGQVKDVWAWVQANTRRSNPTQVTLIPGSPFPTKAYWIELPRMDYMEDAKITAKLDTAANSISIEATGIQSVTLYLNDTLLNLDKPVTVTLNGAEHKDLIPRNFYTMIEQIYSSKNDPGKFYTTSMDYDIPQK